MIGASKVQVCPGKSGKAASSAAQGEFAWFVRVPWLWFSCLPLPFPFPWLLSAWPIGLCSSTPGAFIAKLFVTKADSSRQELRRAVVLFWETAETLSVPTWKSLSEADCTVVFQTVVPAHIIPRWRTVMMHMLDLTMLRELTLWKCLPPSLLMFSQ